MADVNVSRSGLQAVVWSIMLVAGVVVLGLVLLGVTSFQQRATNDHFATQDDHLAATNRRLDEYVHAQEHQRDLDDARACITSHVRYQVFRDIITELTDATDEVWGRYPAPPCDMVAAQRVLATG